jgi:hypothetical protein
MVTSPESIGSLLTVHPNCLKKATRSSFVEAASEYFLPEQTACGGEL